MAVSASPLSNPAVAAPARAAQRRAAGSVPPMLLIGVSTAHYHHNHQLTDARCVTGGWLTGVAVVRHVPRLLRRGAHAGAYGEKGEYARRARNGERPPEKRTGALVCPPKRVQIWDPLRRTESEGGRDLHSWHPARPPVRRNESLGMGLGGSACFVCLYVRFGVGVPRCPRGGGVGGLRLSSLQPGSCGTSSCGAAARSGLGPPNAIDWC